MAQENESFRDEFFTTMDEDSCRQATYSAHICGTLSLVAFMGRIAVFVDEALFKYPPLFLMIIGSSLFASSILLRLFSLSGSHPPKLWKIVLATLSHQ
jgi:hypothetical protein